MEANKKPSGKFVIHANASEIKWNSWNLPSMQRGSDLEQRKQRHSKISIHLRQTTEKIFLVSIHRLAKHILSFASETAQKRPY